MKCKDRSCLLVIFLFALTLIAFLFSNRYYMGDDTVFHISNILDVADGITLKSLFPSKISSLLVNQLGYGVRIFYPPVPHLVGGYLYKILSFWGLDIIFTMKVLLFLIIFFSGVAMYFYVNHVFKNRGQALLSVLLYLAMPYFFTDLFLRGALNESFLFIYLPLIFLSLHYLLVDDDVGHFYFYFILGYTLLICTHLVLTVYVTILIIPFLLVYYRRLLNFRVIRRLLLAACLMLLLSSNFWVPLVEHYVSLDYYIFSVDYQTVGVSVISLFYYFFRSVAVGGANYLLFYVSPVCLICCCFLYFLLYRGKVVSSHKRILLGMVIILVMALFVAFIFSVFGGYGIRLSSTRGQKYVLIIVVVILSVFNYWHTSLVKFSDSDEEYFNE